jgi:hypothetical protein
MTDVVKKKREDNVNYGSIYGLNNDREAALLRTKLFNIFAKTPPKSRHGFFKDTYPM